MPAPLAMPPTDQPSRSATAVFATVSVVRIASAAGAPPSAARARGSGVDAGQQQVHRQPLADEAGRADDDVTRGDPEGGSDVLGGGVGVLEAGGSGAGVGAPAVEHHGIRPAVGDDGA